MGLLSERRAAQALRGAQPATGIAMVSYTEADSNEFAGAYAQIADTETVGGLGTTGVPVACDVDHRSKVIFVAPDAPLFIVPAGYTVSVAYGWTNYTGGTHYVTTGEGFAATVTNLTGTAATISLPWQREGFV
jgi:hypothetical protein